MSELEEAWTNIRSYVTALMDENPTPGQFNPEWAQRRSRVLHSFGKLQNDIDYFLQNAPASDPRRATILTLKEKLDQTQRPD